MKKTFFLPASIAFVFAIFTMLNALAQNASPNIRRIDFRNYSYEPCFEVPGKGKIVRVIKGKYEHQFKEKDFSYGVYFEVRDVIYGDLNGDGKEEAVVETLCNGGGTGQFTDGLIFTLQNDKPVILTNVGGGDRADGGIHEIKIVNGILKVSRYGGNSGACCPDYIETESFKLVGKKLVSQGKPVRGDYIDKNNDRSVHQVKFERGNSSTSIKGTTKGTAEYILGARAGQLMELQVTGQNLTIELRTPDGSEVPQPAPNKIYSLKLPATGDYRISINAEKGTANFVLNIGIK